MVLCLVVSNDRMLSVARLRGSRGVGSIALDPHLHVPSIYNFSSHLASHSSSSTSRFTNGFPVPTAVEFIPHSSTPYPCLLYMDEYMHAFTISLPHLLRLYSTTYFIRMHTNFFAVSFTVIYGPSIRFYTPSSGVYTKRVAIRLLMQRPDAGVE
jgi:hypothetical protein